MPSPQSSGDTAPTAPLREIASVFLKLGTIAFGGPAAHVAMMEDEVVRKRGWLARTEFLDYLGATNLIPGPNSTELAIHVGFVRAGWVGLVLAGVCFIVPAAFIVAVIAWGYVRYGALPAFSGLLYGIKPVVIAIVAQALVRLCSTALRSGRTIAVAVASVIAVLVGVHELLVLLLAGVLTIVLELSTHGFNDPSTLPRRVAAFVPPLQKGLVTAATTIPALAATPSALFGVFVKIGAVLFGSGYVLLAFLRNDIVIRHHWLTEAQLLDAIAVGQMTPGPVFTTATFVGYVAGGTMGAVAATIGIFLPAFVFVAASGPIVPRLRRSRIAGAALDGVNAASLALMAVVSVQLVREALPDLLTIGEAVAALMLLARYRLNSAWLVLGGAAIGLAARVFR